MQNRMYTLRYQLHPEFDALFSEPILATTLALMQAELVSPGAPQDVSLNALTELVRQASHGKLGAPLALALVQSAHTSFASPPLARRSPSI